MKKSCFVIMPYGGNDEEKRRHFAGVYEGIIVPAAAGAGYTVKRSDIAGEPGNITHDIIRDLAEADVVIADLTNGNANVFFELGIRHAFRKSGTVHIIDSTNDIPFDVRQYRAIEYSTELADVPDAMARIAEAIGKRADQPDRADNPVHDAIPALPLDIRATGDEALLRQLEVAEEALKNVRSNNERLSANLARLDPNFGVEDSGSDIDIDALLDGADEIMQSTGQHAILRLRESMQQGGADAFVKELRTVLKSPYVDTNDFAEIVILCKKANLDEHRRATLEVAVKRHPNSEEMFLAYVDALDDSPNPKDRERARIMIEKQLGIELVEGVPRFVEGKTNLPLLHAFAVLFNTYFRARKHDWVLSFIDSLPRHLASESMILRNKARALSELGRTEEADSTHRQAIELDPNEDQNFSSYAHFLSVQRRYAEAYENYEKAISADPEDAKLQITMGIEIFNHGFYRAESGRVEGPLDRKSRANVAVPFILNALQTSPNPGTVQEAVRILVRANAVEEAQAIADGKLPSGDYNLEPLRYVIEMKTPQSSLGQESEPSEDSVS